MTDIGVPETKEKRVEKLKDLLSSKKLLENAIVKSNDKRNEVQGGVLEDDKNLLKLNELNNLCKIIKNCKSIEEINEKVTDEQKPILGEIFKKHSKNKSKHSKNKKIKIKEIEKEIKKEIENLEEQQKSSKFQVEIMDVMDENTRKLLEEKNEEINNYLNNFREGTEFENELEKVELLGQNLSNLNFSNLDLQGAKLSGSVLYGTDFSKSNLKESDLSLIYAPRAKLEEANLEGVVFNTVVDPDSINNIIPEKVKNNRETIINSANLKKANLNGLDLDNVSLEQSAMQEASFENTKFHKNTNIIGTAFYGSDFSKTIFEEGVKFYKARVDSIQKNFLEEKGINVEDCVLDVKQTKPNEQEIQTKTEEGGGSLVQQTNETNSQQQELSDNNEQSEHSLGENGHELTFAEKLKRFRKLECDKPNPTLPFN